VCVRDQVEAQVEDQVGDQVGAQVWDQVRDQVWAQVWDQVEAQVEDHIKVMIYGSQDSGWLSFYSFMHNELDLDLNKLNGLWDMAKSCGWWAPYKNMVIFQDRPQHIKWDEQKRLHNETGPSILYRDGFAVFSWHGVRIPGEWIENKPSAEVAIKWENLEQRRAACEIVGWHNILRQLNARSIDKDDAEIGELLEVDLPEIGTERFLRVMCGTGREFALPVPPDVKTALEANAWTYGLDSAGYNPEVRT